MEVKLKTILAGPSLCGQIGETINVPKHIGVDLVEGGYADLVSFDEKAETPSVSKNQEEAKTESESGDKAAPVEDTTATADETAEAPANKRRRK